MGAHPAARPDDRLTPSPDPAPARPRLLLAGLLVLALIASLVWLAIGLAAAATGDEEARGQDREAVILRAREYVDAAWNYGAGDLDDEQQLTDYRDRVTPLITTSFASEFEKTVPVLQQLINDEGFARQTEVDHVGVETLDADSATAIVSGTITETQGDRQLAPSPFFWELDLEKVDDVWLVSDLGGFQGDR